MNLRELEYICMLARTRHFTRAAEACFVSQPTLSSQVRKLEAELGVVLFERIRGGVRPTAEGTQIIALAERAVAAASDIKSLARTFRDPFSGTFRLGVIPTIGPFLLPIFAGSVRHAFPTLDMSFSEQMTDHLNAELLAGDLDAAILATPPAYDNLTDTPLYDERFFVALPKGHKLCERSDMSLADIQGEPLLLLAEGHCLRDQTLAVCAAYRQNQSVNASSLETLLALVAGGYGITLVPALSIRAGCQEELGVVIKPLSDKNAFRRVNLTTRKTHVRPKLTDAIADLIKSELPAGVTVIN